MAYLPKHGESVTVQDREDRFVVIGIDATNKTVDVRTIADPTVFIRKVSWSLLSFQDDSHNAAPLGPNKAK
jgi:hypothetical protein